jgi:electron transport complex protein RnfA
MGASLSATVVVVLGSALAANCVLAKGLALGVLTQAKGDVKAAAAQGLLALVVVTATAFLSTIHYFYDLETWHFESPFKVMIVLLLGYLVLKLSSGEAELAGGPGLVVVALAASLAVRRAGLTLLASTWYGLGVGLGAAVVFVIVAGILDRLELASVPARFRPAPILFTCLGILALVFEGFGGLLLNR